MDQQDVSFIKAWVAGVVKPILMSKKATAAVLGGAGTVVSGILLNKLHFSEQATSTIMVVLGVIVTSYIGAQGLADQGKEAAKQENQPTPFLTGMTIGSPATPYVVAPTWTPPVTVASTNPTLPPPIMGDIGPQGSDSTQPKQ